MHAWVVRYVDSQQDPVVCREDMNDTRLFDSGKQQERVRVFILTHFCIHIN